VFNNSIKENVSSKIVKIENDERTARRQSP